MESHIPPNGPIILNVLQFFSGPLPCYWPLWPSHQFLRPDSLYATFANHWVFAAIGWAKMNSNIFFSHSESPSLLEIGCSRRLPLILDMLDMWTYCMHIAQMLSDGWAIHEHGTNRMPVRTCDWRWAGQIASSITCALDLFVVGSVGSCLTTFL